MSVQTAAFNENLDEILSAVRETPRGRWFLDSYTQRLKSEDTGKVLDAISKLESHIQSMGNSADTALVQRARQAIAAARREISAIDQKPAELSAEGQMFAKLAQLSKDAFSAQPGLGQGVERALRLVSELDQELSPPAEQAQAAAPPKPAASYFKQDEAVFEPAPAAKIVRVAPKPDPSAEIPGRGAKLVIQRTSPAPAAEPQAAEAPAIVETAKAEEPAVAPQSRIVIIKRKVEDLEAVPLLDQPAEAPSAA